MMSPERSLALFAAAFTLLAAGTPALASGLSGLPFDPTQIDPNNLVSQDVVNVIVKTVGLALDHRPYEPATPLDANGVGLDLSVEMTAVKIPSDLFPTLQANGFASADPGVPFLPAAKFHIHKGLGDVMDVGGSFFYIPNFKIIGTDVKFVLVQGEEGPTVAVRFGYNYTDLNDNGVNISTKTFSPAILMSRQLDFADPYIGVGFQYAIGDIDASAPTSLPPPFPATIGVHGHGSGYGATGFVGVSMKIPRMGLRLTPEMAYSSAGATYFGAKIGFTF